MITPLILLSTLLGIGIGYLIKTNKDGKANNR